MRSSYDASDFERAVAAVSAEPSPRDLVGRLGLEWERLSWLAVDASAAVLAQEGPAPDGRVVAYGSEAFAAGFLVGVHLPGLPRLDPADLPEAVAEVQRRGRHAVIADHCDLASVASIENVYADSLVESMVIEAGAAETAFVTLLFEVGLAVGVLLASGGAADRSAQQP
ncbi:MAG TPA: hypothetical protein VNT23_03920 [Gaiellaceae bacterium]|nr:hypothetical protein [Gaiellaceae bacterium]